MSKIWWLPIEPLEERYSSQWLKWFRIEFDNLGIDYTPIHADLLTKEIRQGSFLDVINTNYYKAGQLKNLCLKFDEGEVSDGDIILCMDGWLPGIEMIAYIRDALDLNIKIYSIFHSGTYDPHDFLSQKGMGKWASELEKSWFHIYDGIFVATEFHKKLILESRNIGRYFHGKIHVTGLPIYPDFVEDKHKENIIVFPHRLDPEKQPDMFDKMAKELRGWDFGWNIVRTKDLCKTKKEYYNLLNIAKISVSCALQETFGIAMIESVMCGCIPIVPNRLSYQELYPTAFRYNDYDDMLVKVRYAIDNHKEFSILLRQAGLKAKFEKMGSEAIKNMCDIMLGGK